MVYEPKERRVPRSQVDPRNPYQGRWRWWYSQIADWMIAHPGGALQDCAKDLNKHINTIYYITKSDMFQEFLAERKAEWRKTHDFAIVQKTTRVAEKALDLMLDKMETQQDKIPMAMISEVASSALDRLGYAPKQGAAVQVNVDNSDNRKVMMVAVSPEALEEARDALRAAEAARAIESRATLELEAGSKDDQGGASPPESSEARNEEFL